tara:strand:- start:182 stop:1921 length:1740 start_codon:yes stop_codon:yes gene_type:complete
MSLKSLNLEVHYEKAIESIKNFLCIIPESEREEIWTSFAKQFFQSLILNATINLKKAIEDPNFPEINKNEPFIETSYPVSKKWSELGSEIEEEIHPILNKKRIKLNSNEEKILNIINSHRMITVDKDFEFEIPKEYLPNEEICSNKTPKIFNETKTPFLRIHFKGSFESTNPMNFEGVIYIIITSLLAIKSTDEVKFPIFVGLTTKKNAHEKFNKSQQKAFWKRLIQLIEGETVLTTPLKEPTRDLSPPKFPLIKSPMHLESLKRGKRPDYQSPIPLSLQSQVDVIGLNLDKKHYHALNAVQQLLCDTNYKGNVRGTTHNGENGFKFSGYLPRIRFSKSQYLEAYGVKKHKTSRDKWEFGGRDSEEALAALKDLATRNHLIICKRKRYERGEEKVDRIQTVSPVIRVFEGWQNLSQEEDEELDAGIEKKQTSEKHSGFVLEPCPILVDQVDGYFMLKPANMYQEIKLKHPNASKYVYAFIDTIIHQCHIEKGNCNHKSWPKFIDFSRETLAYYLRLDSYIKSRNWKRIEQILNKCVQISKSVGWITDHEEIPGKTVRIKDRFYINQIKFEKISRNEISH